MIMSSASRLQKETLYSGYERLISYIANKIKIKGVLTCVFTKDELEYLDNNFDIDKLKTETRDLLTEALEQSKIITPVLRFRFNKIVESKIKEIKSSNEYMPNVLFIQRQPSRLMTEIYKIMGTSCVYILVEPDILQYRIALINIKLFDIPGFCLNADPEIHRIELSSNNWDYCNNWGGVPNGKRLSLL
jgi:hypothetical protein